MSNIGSLVVSLEANIARFESDLGKAEQFAKGAFDRITQAGDMAASAAKNLGMAMAGIGAGVGISTLVSKFESVTASLSSMKEMAERTGASVESLSGVASIAKIGGRDIGEFEGAVSRLNKSLHANDDESKGAGKALAALGLNITDLKRMDPAQAFTEIAKAQEAFADSGGKAAMMMDIFGKAGAAQIPLMHDSAEQGSLVVKTTTQQAEAADRLEKDLKRLTATKEALYKIVAVEIIPVYDSFVKVLIQANNETDGVRKSAKDLATDGSIRSWAEGAAKSAAFVIDAFDGVSRTVQAVGTTIGAAAAQASALMNRDFKAYKSIGADWRADMEALANKPMFSSRLDAMLASDRKGIEGVEKKKSLAGYTGRALSDGRSSAAKSDPLGDWIKDYEAQIKPAISALDAFNKMQRDAEVSGASLTKSERAFYDLINSDDWKMMAEPWKDLVRQQFEAADAAEKAAENEKMLNQLLANTPTAKIEQMRAQMLLLADAFERGRITEEQFIEAAQGLTGMGKEMQQAGSEMDEYAKRAAQSVQSSMANFLFDPFNNGVKGMGQQFAQMIQRMIADAGAAQLSKMMFGTMGQASGGQSGNWGWVGQAATWAASFFADGGVMTAKGPMPLRAYAGGGVASSPQLAMFGEGSTPEAYVPLPDGRSIPVKMQSQGGMTVHQTIYAGQGTDPAQVRRSAAAGARAVLGAMNGARRYG